MRIFSVSLDAPEVDDVIEGALPDDDLSFSPLGTPLLPLAAPPVDALARRMSVYANALNTPPRLQMRTSAISRPMCGLPKNCQRVKATYNDHWNR